MKGSGESFYVTVVKRGLDIVVSAMVLILFCWLYGIIALLVRIKLGSPVLFYQKRPGKEEKIFLLCKFRSMTDERDAAGRLLPDEKRLTNFGKRMRETSLDELPEFWNILRGEMSLVGPRPQLVRDMVFMTPEQRRRHGIKPGLTGLAQISGRNAISWEGKLECDLRYLEKITFVEDLRILFVTVSKVFKREDICTEGMATAEDLGDYLLRTGKITEQEYELGQRQAQKLLDDFGRKTE